MEHKRYEIYKTHGRDWRILIFCLFSLLQTERRDDVKMKIKQKKICSSSPDTSNKFTSSLNLP